MATEYSKSRRKYIAKAFQEARKRLWNGEGYRQMGEGKGICVSLVIVSHYAKPSIRTARGLADASDVVMERLHPSLHVTTYLERIGVLRDSYEGRYDALVQEFRLRWLDALIEEFSK